LFGFAAAVIHSPSALILPVKLGVSFSAGYALIQKVFLEAGVIPFLGYYQLPGYASVAFNAEVILRYIRRPFGFFPEPSFMAGSMALAVAAMVVLVYRCLGRLRKSDLVTIGLAVTAIFLSDSGSGLASIGLVLLMAIWPAFKGGKRLVLAIGIVCISAFLASNVLESRGLLQNYSWSDRLASIIGAMRFLVTSDNIALLGAGKGAGPSLFQRGSIPLDGLQYFTPIPDVFSVLGRLVLECGLVFGLGLIIILSVLLIRAGALDGGLFIGIVFASTWLLIAGLTISYETAAWIWATPGIALGLLQAGPSGERFITPLRMQEA
jgi:hypothetical protein